MMAFAYMSAVDWHLAAADAAANPPKSARTPAFLVSG